MKIILPRPCGLSSLRGASLLLAGIATAAIASTDPVKDTRQIMAGTVSTTKVKNEYLSGAKDGTTAFQGALNAYKAVRAAEVAPAPVPTPTPTPTPSAPATGLGGEVAIADNFNTAAGIEPTWYGATGRGGVPGILPLNDMAAFRIDCAPGQLLKDDPLVLPGQSGASHLHQFWGNTGTNAGSTYASLRTSGQSTCDGDTNAPINRSSYWAPAMMVGPGMALKPDHVLIYYKRFAATSPYCTDPKAPGICVDLPNGIRFVTGYNMKTMSGGPNDTRPYQWDFNFMGFDCYGSEDGTVPGIAGEYHTIKAVADAGCPVGARLHVSIDAPSCWDGHNLDSADHRAHIVYPIGDDLGFGRQCGPDHPFVIPLMSVQLFYNTDAAFAAGKWHLASDEMMPGVEPGTTLHMDYWEAWSPTAKATWMTHCINAPSSCSGGDLGDGTAIIGGNEPFPHGWPRQTAVAATP
jgi:hypothetical protein